jgi:aldehyde:ferredoxin oxidoreductase
VPLDLMLTDYYKERGWDQDSGRPEQETIERLGLSDLVRDYGPEDQ